MDVAVGARSSDENVRHQDSHTSKGVWHQGGGTLREGCVHPAEQLLLWGLLGRETKHLLVDKVLVCSKPEVLAGGCKARR